MTDLAFQNSRPDLKEKARLNRSNPSPAELAFWYKLLKNDQTGYRFLRQKPILNFILDFYCSKLHLAIEIDGHSHGEQIEYDKQRTQILNSIGIKVIRYSNFDIENNTEGVYDNLCKEIYIREKELSLNPSDTTSPTPLPEGG